MKSPDGNYFNIGRRLTLTLALLIALILGGNGLVILQFEKARSQTNRLTGVSQQLITVLRLQESLLSFHQSLNELTQAKDAQRLVAETGPLRTALLEQAQQTRSTLAYLPPELRLDTAFLTALDTIEITLPLQLQEVTALAIAGDWEAVRLRLDNELKRMESATSALVKSIDRDLDQELPHVVVNMIDVQRRILLIVPVTAISTVLIAAFFGWAIARRILELRLEAQVSAHANRAGFARYPAAEFSRRINEVRHGGLLNPGSPCGSAEPAEDRLRTGQAGDYRRPGGGGGFAIVSGYLE